MHHGHGPRHEPHQQETPGLPAKGSPVQQVQGRKKHRPSKQGGPLGEHHVHQHVDPADVLPDEVGGGLVKGGEDAGEVLPAAAQEVQEAKAPVAHKEHPGQGGTALFRGHPGKKGVNSKKHLGPRRPHGKLVGKPQGRPQQVQAGGDAVRQKRIGEPRAGQQGVIRGEVPLVCQAGEEAQVHAHVPVGGLAGIDRAALPAERMPHQKAEEPPHPQHHPEEFSPAKGGEGLADARAATAFPQGRACAEQGQRQGPQVGRRGKAQRKGKQHGEPLQAQAAPHAAQQQPDPGAFPGQGQPGQAQAAELAHAKIGQGQKRPRQ